jgi:hypothetical protein
MDHEKRESRKIQPKQTPFIKKAWLNLVILVLAGASIGFGLYLRARPDSLKRTDIGEYNLGVSTYNDMPTLRGAGTTEKASVYFEKAVVQSNDPKVRALALCNLGTMKGKLARDSIHRIQEAYAVKRAKGVEQDENLLAARQEIRKSIQKLAESVRVDPTLEDAKFNLELLETERGEGGGILGSRYSPGQVDKGY